VIGDSVTPADINDKLLAGVKEQQPVSWQEIRAPGLAIFATFSREHLLPWYRYLGADQQAVFDRAWPPIVKWHEDTIRRLRTHAPRWSAVGDLPQRP
jgi:hypothetical protein